MVATLETRYHSRAIYIHFFPSHHHLKPMWQVLILSFIQIKKLRHRDSNPDFNPGLPDSKASVLQYHFLLQHLCLCPFSPWCWVLEQLYFAGLLPDILRITSFCVSHILFYPDGGMNIDRRQFCEKFQPTSESEAASTSQR